MVKNTEFSGRASSGVIHCPQIAEYLKNNNWEKDTLFFS